MRPKKKGIQRIEETPNEMVSQGDDSHSLNGRGEVLDNVQDNISDTSENLWESIGFHRPLAGFWYQFALSLIHITTASFATITLFPLMFPFPQIDGYYRTATGVFVAIFAAFDLGTANLMSRFIGETSIKDPKKMILYIQYFIWYQMFSGLIQVAGIAIWALYFPTPSLIFLSWIFVVYSTTQYPAMQNIFRMALESLQQFDKSSIIGFIQGDVIQRFTEIGFVIGLRYSLGQDPKFGIILAASIGLCLGQYLDDYIAMIIGMKYFNSIMKDYELTIKDCFRHDFDFDLVKESFLFGLKTGIPGVLNGFVGLIVLTWWLEVPQYPTFIALQALAASIVNFIQGLKINLGGAISESYLNGKKELCRYYIGQSWRFDGFIQIMLYSIIIVITFILKPVFLFVGLDKYVLAIPFIIPLLIRRFISPYEEIAGRILTGTDHPNINFVISMIGLCLNLFSWYLILRIFQLPQIYGISLIFWILPMGDMFVAVLMLIISYLIIHNRIIRLKIPWYQTFIGTGAAGTLIVIIGLFLTVFLFDPIRESIGLVPALISLVILFLFGGPIFYFSLTAYIGVWDDGSVRSFKTASEMAGIAKLFTVTLYTILIKSVKFSKLHNKFGMDESDALVEAAELMEIRKRNIEKE